MIGYSQTPPNPQSDDGDGLPPPPGTPIDGGISYLVVAGAVYGVYKLLKKK
ncbi:PID-CTERM protein-sorting domain-containing protein [Lutibacter holmesii]|uniref:PID-CTERM protein-sorting domain-containing protein n=1 Tax=Lutibacter holmesii TaxID=1137985 RepID=A0ABW3WNC2_9FLAO